MPPNLALLLCSCFIFWLFRQDLKYRRAPSSAIWIPGIWLTVIASRPVSYWLGVVGIGAGGAASTQEGSPIDLAVFLVLMIAALVVLSRRNFTWGEFIPRNKVLILVYCYLIITALWAQDSLPTVKRAVKDFGSVMVGLVLLTESNPLDVIRMLFVRVSYLLFPLSVLFIKWFPHIGRAPSRGGENLFGGVCDHKSALGGTVLVLGVVLMVDVLGILKSGDAKANRKVLWIRYVMLAMGAWLLKTCHSATGIICFVLAILLLWGIGRMLRLGDPARMLFRCVALLICLVIFEKAFDVSGVIMTALGKNKTLSGRTEIWDLVKHAQTDPLLGSGYYSFWENRKAQVAITRFAGTLSSAHNGYLETYLDTGFIGVAVLITMLLIWGRRAMRRMLSGTLFGRLAFTFWVLAILFNNSETSFFRLNPMWFALLLTMVAWRTVDDEVPEPVLTPEPAPQMA